MTAWRDDPRSDEQLLEDYCIPLQAGEETWWAFPEPVPPSTVHGVPRPAAAQAEFIRAYLLLGHEPGDTMHSSIISQLVMKVAELNRRCAGLPAE